MRLQDVVDSITVALEGRGHYVVCVCIAESVHPNQKGFYAVCVDLLTEGRKYDFVDVQTLTDRPCLEAWLTDHFLPELEG